MSDSLRTRSDSLTPPPLVMRMNGILLKKCQAQEGDKCLVNARVPPVVPIQYAECSVSSRDGFVAAEEDSILDKRQRAVLSAGCVVWLVAHYVKGKGQTGEQTRETHDSSRVYFGYFHYMTSV